MGLLVKFLAFLLVLGLAGLFVLKKPDGTPWLTLDDLVPSASDLSLPDNFPGMGDETTAYRWQDDQGRWHFSDEPPVDGEGEEITLSAEINSIPAPTRKVSSNKGETPSITDGVSLSPLSVPVDQVPQLIDDAKNVQELVDERHKNIAEAID